jgi:mono/diheme cytochrome c family protein
MVIRKIRGGNGMHTGNRIPAASSRLKPVIVAAAVSIFLLPAAITTGMASERDEAYHRDYVYGAPDVPSEAWMNARGARLYDNWSKVLDVDGPEETHAAWPASNTSKKGGTTWRCKSCHGWDTAGAGGAYAEGSYATGITGTRAYAGKDPADIHAIIMDETHGYTHEMIPMEDMLLISAFISNAQIETSDHIAADKTVAGDAEHGKAIFQNTCAACHGFDGKALDWGDDNEPGYVGTEAQSNPWEVLHKIRFGHPGVEMISLSAFPVQDSLDVLKYTQSLPAE